MNCTRCGIQIKTVPNLKFCDTCREINRKEVQQRSNECVELRRKHEKEGKRAAITKFVPAITGKISTDAEQTAHNMALDRKYNIPPVTVIYTPGTKEFKRVAQEIIDRRLTHAN